MKLKTLKLTTLFLTLVGFSASAPFIMSNISHTHIDDNDVTLIRNYIKTKEEEYKQLLSFTNQLKDKLNSLNTKVEKTIERSDEQYNNLLDTFNNQLVNFTEFKYNSTTYVLVAIDKTTNEFVELENYTIDPNKHNKIEKIEKVATANISETSDQVKIISQKIKSLSKILSNVVEKTISIINEVFKEFEQLNNFINRTINQRKIIDLVGSADEEMWSSLSLQEKIDLIKNKVDNISHASLDITKRIQDASEYKERLEDKLNGFSISTTELSLKIKKYWNLIIKHKFKQTDKVETAINYIKEILTEEELSKIDFLRTRSNENIERETITFFISQTNQDGSQKTKTVVLDEVKFTYDDEFIKSIRTRVDELFKDITLPKDKIVIKNSELLDIIKNNFSNEKEKLAIHLKDINDYNKKVEDKIEIKYSYDSQVYTYKIPERKIEVIKPTVYLDENNKVQKTFDTDLSIDKYFSVEHIKEIGYFKDESSNLIKAVRMPVNVITVPDKLPEEIESTESMFEGAIDFNGNLSSWDVSNVRVMKNMFKKTKGFNGDLSSWNVSNVIDTSGMFHKATAFNRPINSWSHKTRNIENMESMFEGATVFDQNLNDWDTSNVTNMKSLFKNAESFNGNITTWNTENVINMGHMFEEAEKFNKNLTKWNVSKVKYMNHMFVNTTISTSLFEWSNKISSLEEMEYMFAKSKFDRNEEKSISSWNISSIKSLKGLFQGSDYNLNLNGKFSETMSNVIDFSYMFSNESKFNREIKDWDLFSAITVKEMFSGNKVFNQKLDALNNTNKLKDVSGMLKNAVNFNQPINFEIENVTDMSEMFQGAKALTDEAFVGMGQWRNKTKNVETVRSMFAYTEKFEGKSLEIVIDFENVRDFSSMFENATSFNGEIKNWRFVKFRNNKCAFNVNMENMFNNATSFNQSLGVSWQSKLNCVENINGMFNGATSFNQNISQWSLPIILGGILKTENGSFIKVRGNNNYKFFNQKGHSDFTLDSGNLPKGMEKIEGIR
ncbi:BspA family leucine-rich repeat surface protein [Mycoplasma yeatsii]|uniref:Surface protein n=1 Tax=Mycoplasma yeatsii TaxID=51365 RepID=A0ABU0NE64_9MOLU|nr:BspA family leucine-rich repeat surface protein [Mycoplasma yeatsii]MDQ0567733.1 surface protein [Mycoplasma yeatsii]